MAGNKFDTQFPKHSPDNYVVMFLDQNDDVVKWNGTARQMINNILQQQLI